MFRDTEYDYPRRQSSQSHGKWSRSWLWFFILSQGINATVNTEYTDNLDRVGNGQSLVDYNSIPPGNKAWILLNLFEWNLPVLSYQRMWELRSSRASKFLWFHYQFIMLWKNQWYPNFQKGPMKAWNLEEFNHNGVNREHFLQKKLHLKAMLILFSVQIQKDYPGCAHDRYKFQMFSGNRITETQ